MASKGRKFLCLHMDRRKIGRSRHIFSVSEDRFIKERLNLFLGKRGEIFRTRREFLVQERFWIKEGKFLEQEEIF